MLWLQLSTHVTTPIGSYMTLNQAKTHKMSISTPIGGLSWREIEPEHGRTTFYHVYIYNVETMFGSRFIFNNGNTHNGLISDPKGWSEPPKQACLHLLVACRDLTSSQSMVELHSVMSIYNVETMLGSRFIFNNGNTHNRLISDPKVNQSPQNKHINTPLGGLSWPEIEPEHGRTTFFYVYI